MHFEVTCPVCYFVWFARLDDPEAARDELLKAALPKLQQLALIDPEARAIADRIAETLTRKDGPT